MRRNDFMMPKPEWPLEKTLAWLRCSRPTPYLEFQHKMILLADTNIDTPEAAALTIGTLDDIASRFLCFRNEEIPTGSPVIQITVDEGQLLWDLFRRKLDGLKREHGVNFGRADAVLAACVALARAMLQIMYGYYSFGRASLPLCTCHRTRTCRKMKRRIP